MRQLLVILHSTVKFWALPQSTIRPMKLFAIVLFGKTACLSTGEESTIV